MYNVLNHDKSESTFSFSRYCPFPYTAVLFFDGFQDSHRFPSVENRFENEDECGELIRRHFQAKTEKLGENSASLPLCLTQISSGLSWNGMCASSVRGRRSVPLHGHHELYVNNMYKYSFYLTANTLIYSNRLLQVVKGNRIYCQNLIKHN